MTGLQTNRIYSLINGLKTQKISITSFEHVFIVKRLIYKLLLCCHITKYLVTKWYKIFQAFKGFSGSFNKHDQVNGSAKQYIAW